MGDEEPLLFLPGFIETINRAIKRIGIDRVAMVLGLSPKIVKGYAAGIARPVEYRQLEIIDTLSQYI